MLTRLNQTPFLSAFDRNSWIKQGLLLEIHRKNLISSLLFSHPPCFSLFCIQNTPFLSCFFIQNSEKQGGWSIKKAYLDKKFPRLSKKYLKRPINTEGRGYL